MGCLDPLLSDGKAALDNNPAERALRGVAVGHKTYLFAGSDRGAGRVGAQYSLIKSANLIGVDLEAYVRDVLAASPTTPPHASPTYCHGPGPQTSIPFKPPDAKG